MVKEGALFSTCYVPGTVLDNRQAAADKAVPLSSWANRFVTCPVTSPRKRNTVE